jgi:hypothetical protein
MIFTATVQGASDLRVSWRVNDINGGYSTVGTIASNGVYTAPASVPNPPAVTIRAVSIADATKSGAATVTIVRK